MRRKKTGVGQLVNLMDFLGRLVWPPLAKMFAALLLGTLASACSGLIEGEDRGLQPLSSQTVSALEAMGSSPGEAMMVRIYKQSSELEVWKRVGDGTFKLFKTYAICTFSGELGPKIFEGDRQSPEGFYTVTRGLMNPRSQYYLAFNLGFPNKFDRAYGRTGSNIMVHGDCSSRGCYAMTDEQVAEIYALARESFSGGNRSFQVQVYPFRMTPENLAAHSSSPNLAYWQNLKTGLDHSEVLRGPTSWDVCNKEYVFDVRAASGQPLDAEAACPVLIRDASLEARVDARQRADRAAFEMNLATRLSFHQLSCENSGQRLAASFQLFGPLAADSCWLTGLAFHPLVKMVCRHKIFMLVVVP